MIAGTGRFSGDVEMTV